MTVIQKTRLLFIALLVLSFFACDSAKKVDLEVELNVMLDGQPASRAKVQIQGTEVGATDQNGHFLNKLQQLPGTEVTVAVNHATAGYRITPWQHAFVTKLPQDGAVERYAFDVDLQATPYFTLFVNDNGEPVEGAAVKIQKKFVADTNALGELTHEFGSTKKGRLYVQVVKDGYATWKKTIRVKPGDQYEVGLSKKQPKPEKVVAQKPAVVETPRAAPKPAEKTVVVAAKAPSKPKPQARKAVINVNALTAAYGVTKRVPGVSVYVNGQKVGETDARGAWTYVYKGKSVESAAIALKAPGYIPETWETAIPLAGKQLIERYFYPANPMPIRVGIYGYVNNSPDQDLTAEIEAVENAVSNNLFKYTGFRQVPKHSLRAMMLQADMDMETATTRGWQDTRLSNAVDMIITGSLTADNSGLTVETTVVTADGKILLSQINRVRKKSNIRNTAKLMVGGIVDQFPFEGTVTAVEGDVYRINLGKDAHRIRRGNSFKYMLADTGRSGRFQGYREAGMFRVFETEKDVSLLEIVELAEDARVRVGDRVVRRIYIDERREKVQGEAVVRARGGLPPDDKPLWGVNVYLNNTWVGTTGARGTVKIPVSVYEEYDILLSRHGYQQIRDTISIGEDKETKEFSLEIADALFKVESEPSGAEVFIDGVSIGKTPIYEGQLINFGFRKIKLSVGGDYRDWQAVIEVNQPEIDRTGSKKIVFLKDYLKIGREAEKRGEVDTAISAYVQIERENPDYSAVRCRLAQLYMDEKNNYDGAVKEFENVLALPENKQIIYKQFAVTYTNLGHAYYETGNRLLRKDPRGAAQNFAKAIKKLDVARQNTRFFPSSQYNEAVHDTYYYRALSYHKLYQVTNKRALIHKTDRAWQEYFDFFPAKLKNEQNFIAMRSGAQKYWTQIKNKK